MSSRPSATRSSEQQVPVWLDARFDRVLRRRALALTGHRGTADDLVQDTYERALRAPIANSDNEHAVMAWLKRIAYNRFIDEKRRDRTRASVIWDEVFPSPPANDVGEHLPRWRMASDEEMEALIERLPPIHQEILREHLRGESTESMAERFNIDCNTVASRLFRARAHLRAMAGTPGDDEGPR
jgi:RNA polymerase sigma-70 factor, ECF subfamily